MVNFASSTIPKRATLVSYRISYLTYSIKLYTVSLMFCVYSFHADF